MTLRLALLGNPVQHSLSPVLHTAFGRAAGIEVTYDRIELDPDTDAAGLHAVLEDRGLDGANITVPFKTRITQSLDALGPTARLTGAVNTLCRTGSTWRGLNTDGAGFLGSLRAEGASPGAVVVVLGAGGAGRAIAAACAGYPGVEQVHLLNRTPARAVAAASELESRLVSTDATPPVRGGPLDAFAALAPRADLVVCAVSGPGRAAIADLDPTRLRPHVVWVDLNYWDPSPPLSGPLRQRGIHVIEGLGMLVHQAALGFDAFTGHSARADPAVGFAALAGGSHP